MFDFDKRNVVLKLRWFIVHMMWNNLIHIKILHSEVANRVVIWAIGTAITNCMLPHTHFRAKLKIDTTWIVDFSNGFGIVFNEIYMLRTVYSFLASPWHNEQLLIYICLLLMIHHTSILTCYFLAPSILKVLPKDKFQRLVPCHRRYESFHYAWFG